MDKSFVKQDTSLGEVNSSVDTYSHKGFRRILAYFGPAYLVSVGYMDPGNWATDLQGGAQFGYRLIWVLLMSNFMALILQNLSARLGIVRRKDLAQASREIYPPVINFCLYILAELPAGGDGGVPRGRGDDVVVADVGEDGAVPERVDRAGEVEAEFPVIHGRRAVVLDGELAVHAGAPVGGGAERYLGVVAGGTGVRSRPASS